MKVTIKELLDLSKKCDSEAMDLGASKTNSYQYEFMEGEWEIEVYVYKKKSDE